MPETKSKTSGSLYPAFLDLRGKKCVVIGGGKVAQRKVGPLLEAGALVWVCSPVLTPALSGMEEEGRIKHLSPRAFFRGGRGLEGACLVFCATDSHAENERIASLAHAMGIPVNVASGTARSSFIVPSVVRRGPLMIAVSTSGASPAMSKSIRLELQRFYGAGFARYLRGLSSLRRKTLKEKELSASSRKRLFKSLGSSDIIKRIRAGELSSPEGAL